MAEIRLSRDAARDLDAIEMYSLECFGADAAEAYADQLQAALDRLGDLPELGQVATDMDARSLKAGSHRIFYRVDPAEIVILRILHHAQDAVRWIEG